MKRFLPFIGLLVIVSWGCPKPSSQLKIEIDPEALNERDELYELFTEIQSFYQQNPESFDEIHTSTVLYPQTYSDYKKPNAKALENVLKQLFTPEQMETLNTANVTDVNSFLGFYTAITTAISTLAPEQEDGMDAKTYEDLVIQHYHDVLAMFLGSNEMVEKLTKEGLLENYFDQLGMALYITQLMNSGLDGLLQSGMLETEELEE